MMQVLVASCILIQCQNKVLKYKISAEVLFFQSNFMNTSLTEVIFYLLSLIITPIATSTTKMTNMIFVIDCCLRKRIVASGLKMAYTTEHKTNRMEAKPTITKEISCID
jgi:hypothetical protein